jgi:hypothetical protein
VPEKAMEVAYMSAFPAEHASRRVEHGEEPVNRAAVGSLAGQMDLSGDWDARETNDDIAADFEDDVKTPAV